MGPVKRFLLGLVVVYMAIALPLSLMYGPPGFSAEYAEQFQPEIDHYYEVVKDPVYKLWLQRPHLVEADPELNTAEFQGNVAFVQEFGETEAFHAELHRRELYELFFHMLNASTSVVLIVGLGRKPIMGFLAKQVDEIRVTLETAENARATAKQARAEAEQKMTALESEARELAEQAESASTEVVAQLQSETESLLASLEDELALRKKIETQRAAMALKQQLVEQAAEKVEQMLVEQRSSARQRLLIQQFITGLEGAAK